MSYPPIFGHLEAVVAVHDAGFRSLGRLGVSRFNSAGVTEEDNGAGGARVSFDTRSGVRRRPCALRKTVVRRGFMEEEKGRPTPELVPT